MKPLLAVERALCSGHMLPKQSPLRPFGKNNILNVEALKEYGRCCKSEPLCPTEFPSECVVGLHVPRRDRSHEAWLFHLCCVLPLLFPLSLRWEKRRSCETKHVCIDTHTWARTPYAPSLCHNTAICALHSQNPTPLPPLSGAVSFSSSEELARCYNGAYTTSPSALLAWVHPTPRPLMKTQKADCTCASLTYLSGRNVPRYRATWACCRYSAAILCSHSQILRLSHSLSGAISLVVLVEPTCCCCSTKDTSL